MSDNSLPLVSIFVISYNGREFLREAIESFLAQTYQNIEICISDDASTDGTRELLLEYKEKLGDRFKYNINPVNLGITRNSNKCLELCGGEYIAYCGGDDLFLPRKIEEQVKFMIGKDNVVASYTDSEIFDNNTNKTINFSSNINRVVNEGRLSDVLKHGCYFGACTVMVKNYALVNFDEQLPVASDFFQMVEILAQNVNYKLVYINGVFSRYRRHDSNITNRLNTGVLQQNHIDHINSYIKTISKYPEYSNCAMLGLSRVYRSYGKYINKKYYIAAFYAAPYFWKNIILFLKYKLKG